jgi:hypothetical protein
MEKLTFLEQLVVGPLLALATYFGWTKWQLLAYFEFGIGIVVGLLLFSLSVDIKRCIASRRSGHAN